MTVRATLNSVLSHAPYFSSHPVVLQPNVGHGLLILEFSSSYTTLLHIGRTSVGKQSPRCGDLYLTTHNTHKRQTSSPPAGFEPTILEGEVCGPTP